MIVMKNSVPHVYMNQSRDFQFIGRLYEMVLNNIKTEADLIYNIPFSDNINNDLLSKLALTLGFKIKHKYNDDQLKAVCSILPKILKYKGTITAIELVCRAISRAEGQTEEIIIDQSNAPNILIIIPKTLSDITLLRDLFDYILPAGISCNIARAIKLEKSSYTEFQFNSSVKYTAENDYMLGKLYEKASDTIYGGRLNNMTVITKENKEGV